MAWLTNWHYRKPITITNSGSMLSDYQVVVTVDIASLVSVGKMLPNGNDIRFTSSNGFTILNYWIEPGTNPSATNIWIKVPSILPGPNVIYIYYGNSLATAASNGDSTFTYFDDFNSSANWNLLSPYGIISGGKLEINVWGETTSSQVPLATFKTPMPLPYVFMYNVKIVTDTRHPDKWFDQIGVSSAIPTTRGESLGVGYIGSGLFTCYGATSPTPMTIAEDIPYTVSHEVTSTYDKMSVGNIYSVCSIVHSDNIYIGLGNYYEHVTHDWMAIRKFADTVPTVSVIGSEQLSSSVWFNTNPEGVAIILNTVQIGTTPATVYVTPGTYDYILRMPCYGDVTGQFTIDWEQFVAVDKVLSINTGALSILSTPSPADVQINGTPTGPTPLNMSCQPEATYQYDISLATYQSHRGYLTVVRNQTASVDVTLLPLGPEGTGSLYIDSIPPGANIYIDGVLQVGVVTPGSITGLSVGPHRVTLVLDGYYTLDMLNVMVDLNVTTDVLTQLTPSDQLPVVLEGCILFDSNPRGAEIFLVTTVGGTLTDMGQVTPYMICGLPLNTSLDYKLTLTGYQDIIGSTALSTGTGIGNTISPTMTLEEGCIFFNTDPQGADIYLDGNPVSIGQTPYIKCGLSLGHHTYTLVLADHTTVTGGVDVTAGEGTTISVPLTPCTPSWQCETPPNGYESDGCGNRRLNEACNPCVPNWQCETPPNGYESDGCGNRRLNSTCNPPVEAGVDTTGMLFLIGIGAGLLYIHSKGVKGKSLKGPK